MMPKSHHEGRPPSFNGDTGHQSFRAWVTDLMQWCMGSDRSPHQQVIAVIDNLHGTAREMARTLSPAEILNGGVLNGVHRDPISYLVHGLNPHFSQFDEEYRLQAMTEFLGFQRRSNESINTLLARYELIRTRELQDGGMDMSIESHAMHLFRILGVSTSQTVEFLRPFCGLMPQTQQEYRTLQSQIRRRCASLNILLEISGSTFTVMPPHELTLIGQISI